MDVLENVLQKDIVTRSQKYLLATRTELVVLRDFLKNEAILEPILLYCTFKCKETAG